uniref:Uncharacterized protein n=1 Tax=Opuntia streptacantha TaxID=393608 RepID=A0A7C9D7M2_OPUST
MEFACQLRCRFYLTLLISILSCSAFVIGIQDIDLERPVLTIKPVPLPGLSHKGSKEPLSCERVCVVPVSRHKLKSYASSVRLLVVPSVVIPEKLHSRIQVCLHRNASIGLCQCEKDEWKSVQKGLWSSMTSPYEEKYIDVKVIGDVSGSVTITVEEVFQHWRLICLAFGVILLLLAPIVSAWVPFYYSSSMAIGILLVVIILLFQGMKLLPTGRKNFFYLAIYGSLVGVGSFIFRQFTMIVNSILVNFGLSEELHNPVSIFLLVGIVLAGAALGYWMVRRFVISDDGSVDVGVAQFVKWAMRLLASTFILQGTPDPLFALATLVLSWIICSSITYLLNSGGWSPQWRRNKQLFPRNKRAEFLRKSPKTSPQGKFMRSSETAPRWWGSPVRGLMSPTIRNWRASPQRDCYSTFHRMPRRKMSKKEWEEWTREFTREAMEELVSTPEFSEWLVEHADRIQLRPRDSSDDEAGSSSDSTDETVVENGPGLGIFDW